MENLKTINWLANQDIRIKINSSAKLSQKETSY